MSRWFQALTSPGAPQEVRVETRAIAKPAAKPHHNPFRATDELQRVLDLPEVGHEVVPDYTDELLLDKSKRHWKDGKEARLRPIQNQMLHAMKNAQGGFFLVSVGGGKCVQEHCRVYDANTGIPTPAGTLVGRTLDVVSLQESTLKQRSNSANGFSSGTKYCVDVVLQSGTVLPVSTDHQVFTDKGWVPAGELTADHLIATSRKLPEPLHPQTLADAEVRMLAYALADAHTARGHVWFTDNNESVLREVLEDANELFGKLPHCVRVRPSGVTEIRCKGSADFVQHFDLAYLSKDKKLPDAVYSLPNTQVALFLSRFIACDGYVGSGSEKRCVEITLASEQLVDGLRTLLLRLGVLCRKSYKRAQYTHKGEHRTSDAWKLLITGKSALTTLFDQVPPPPGIEDRWAALQQRVASVDGNSNVDVVPMDHARYKELKLPGVWKNWKYHKTSLLSREAFQRVINESGYVGEFRHLADSDVFWDRLKELRYVGMRPVVDLSVERDHNFLAENVVIHNSFAALLAGSVIPNVTRVIAFTPASTVGNLRAEMYRLRNLFRLPKEIDIRSTDELSQPRTEAQGDLLEELVYAKHGDPATTLLVFDEAHRLKNVSSARGGRVMRFILAHPEVRMVVMSGTMTASSVKDCAHLSWYALRDRSPFPARWGLLANEKQHSILEALSQCIDQKGKPEAGHWSTLYRMWIKYHPHLPEMWGVPGPDRVSMMRRAFQARMRTTEGVVFTTGSAVPGLPLTLVGLRAPVPSEIRQAIADLESGVDPNGMPIPDDLSLQRVTNQLAQGFFYVWDWPTGPDGKPKVDLDWKAAKSRWGKMVRDEIKNYARTGYDSDFLVYNKCKQDLLTLCRTQQEKDWVEWVSRTDKDELIAKVEKERDDFDRILATLQMRSGADELLQAWLSWSAIQKHKKEPPTKGVWISTFLIDFIVDWAKKQKHPPILWYEHRAVEEKLASRGIPTYGAGTDPPEKETLCALSRRAHGEGKNLQAWCNQVFMCPPVGAVAWEQTLGRTHRPDPSRDVKDRPPITAYVCLHVEAYEEAINKARQGATYIQDTTDTEQKLLFCTYEDIRLRKVTFGKAEGLDEDEEEE